jgi:hypothetical protein
MVVIVCPSVLSALRCAAFFPQLPVFAFSKRDTNTFLTGDPAKGINYLDVVWKANAKIEDSCSEV